MLISIENVLNGDEVTQFRAELDGADWQDGAATAGSLARHAKHNLQLADNAAAAVRLGNHILQKLGSHPLFVSAALPAKIYPPKFNCYTDGGDYATHIDSAIMQLPGSGAMLRSDLSATLFLSDPADYDGGELEIEASVGVQPIKLEAGSMILYPSSSLHRVTPVTRGRRIAAFFWIESMVKDDGERTLLFDLDQSIQRLTATVGTGTGTNTGKGKAELLTLTGVYHNLLRRWAHS
jgi:PKHD-type hydroxylase